MKEIKDMILILKSTSCMYSSAALKRDTLYSASLTQ